VKNKNIDDVFYQGLQMHLTSAPMTGDCVSYFFLVKYVSVPFDTYVDYVDLFT
jgi:hypothetical protein